jgi:hypothetical protein
MMPEPLFILSAPRSFSSVVCGLVGQHPDCYGLPELNLFMADDLGSLWWGPLALLPIGKHGLLRALAQLHEGEQTEDSVSRANEWVLRHSRWSPTQVLQHIQELVGAKILVEKSPATVFRQDYLDRLVRHYPRASYLHLTRHPRGTAESMLRLRERHMHDMPATLNAADPERIWRRSHEAIMKATESLPNGQCMRLQGEAFLGNLEFFLPQICEWLGVRNDPEAIEAMMHPERSPYSCPGPRGAPLGNDINFLESPEIDRSRLARATEPTLDGELTWRKGEGFGKPTISLARQFGYT